MAKLLVSVRSAPEAVAALAGGAGIIDVKEPRHGSLGRASNSIWREVQDVVPRHIPVSVALGEMTEWSVDDAAEVPLEIWSSLTYCKLGLANACPDWADRWRDLRDQLAHIAPAGPAWVAVVYTDWQAARAPAPESIVDEASTIEDCAGVLFDSWQKSSGRPASLAWSPLIDRVRNSGRFVALAGSLDVASIGRLASLQPDIFAVRGAACVGGNRLGQISTEHVSALVQAARSPG